MLLFSGCQKRIVGEGLHLSATNFTKCVRVCVSVDLKKKITKTAKARCRDTYPMSFFQSDLTLLFFVLEKIKEGMACPARGVLPFLFLTL